jgi:hypothetical protein
MFRLLLEYSRLGADDRDAFSFTLDKTSEELR